MRYGARPEGLAEWLAFFSGKVPVPVLDTLVPLVQTRALMAAANHGVFSALADGPADAPALAARCNIDAECLRLVLRVLESMRYVQRQGASWTLGALGRHHFGADSRERCDAFLAYGSAQWGFIGHLDQVLEGGAGIDFHAHQTPEEWRAYQAAMLETARAFAPFVARKTPVPAGARSCLDVAGSHGLVGGLLCMEHPGMRSTVLDRGEALASAHLLGQGEPWYRHVTFREGDLLRGPLGEAEHDVVLLCNILHHFSPETNRDILRRAHAALKPGGTLAIFDIETPEPSAPAEAAADSLALFFRITSTSRCFGGRDYVTWLEGASYQAPRVLRSLRLPSRMLVLAQR
jgi:hypothetical protein